MLRAARFIAGYDLTPDADLVDAVVEMRGRLSIVSAERVRDELDKLIVVDDPSAGLWFLVDTGLIDEFLPELTAMRLEQDPIHRHKDVLAHTIAVVGNVRARLDDGTANRVTRLAALFHDVGKPRTRAIGADGVSFHHHEVVGARMTRDRMRALKYPNDDVEAITQLVYLHLRFHTYGMGWTDSAVRRFHREMGPYMTDLFDRSRADDRSEVVANEIVVIHPVQAPAKVTLDRKLGPVVELVDHRLARRTRLQTERVAAEIGDIATFLPRDAELGTEPTKRIVRVGGECPVFTGPGLARVAHFSDAATLSQPASNWLVHSLVVRSRSGRWQRTCTAIEPIRTKRSRIA
jgi:putative nucleotidyltransferase with HDIG domain